MKFPSKTYQISQKIHSKKNQIRKTRIFNIRFGLRMQFLYGKIQFSNINREKSFFLYFSISISIRISAKLKIH